MNERVFERDLFVVKLATSKEDYDFVTKLVRQEPLISAGAHSISHVGPILTPGFFIGYLNGERLGHVCAVKCGDGTDGSLYYVSFYFVDKRFRGKGYGLKIWNVMWESLPKDENISLDGLLNTVPRYERMGLRQEWNNKEYIVSCSKVVEAFQTVMSLSIDIDIKQLSEVDFEKLFEYDTSVFGFLRCDFLKKWITVPESLGWVATNKVGDTVGYAIIRYSVMEKHQVVGPLFCDDTHIARILLHTAAKAAIEQKSAEKLTICTPVGVNPDAADMIETDIGYESVLELIRMYSKGVPPKVGVKKIMAITSAVIG